MWNTSAAGMGREPLIFTNMDWLGAAIYRSLAEMKMGAGSKFNPLAETTPAG